MTVCSEDKAWNMLQFKFLTASGCIIGYFLLWEGLQQVYLGYTRFLWIKAMISFCFLKELASSFNHFLSCFFLTFQVYVYDAEAYTYDDEMIKKAEAMGKPGLVEIHAKEDSFIFTVESTGAIKASQLVFNAIDVLKQKLDAVRLSADTVEADEQFGELGAHMRGG